jgi:DNA-binding transcriptional MerR regulator
MEERFYTTKQAAQVTGCTVRQVQYWRKQKLVMPTIDVSGTGHSIYYSRDDLTELAIIFFFLQHGYSLEAAREVLKQLAELNPNYKLPENRECYLWRWNSYMKTMVLTPYSSQGLEDALASKLASVALLSLEKLQKEIHRNIYYQHRLKTVGSKNDDVSKFSERIESFRKLSTDKSAP